MPPISRGRNSHDRRVIESMRSLDDPYLDSRGISAEIGLPYVTFATTRSCGKATSYSLV